MTGVEPGNAELEAAVGPVELSSVAGPDETAPKPRHSRSQGQGPTCASCPFPGVRCRCPLPMTTAHAHCPCPLPTGRRSFTAYASANHDPTWLAHVVNHSMESPSAPTIAVHASPAIATLAPAVVAWNGENDVGSRLPRKKRVATPSWPMTSYAAHPRLSPISNSSSTPL